MPPRQPRFACCSHCPCVASAPSAPDPSAATLLQAPWTPPGGRAPWPSSTHLYWIHSRQPPLPASSAASLCWWRLTPLVRERPCLACSRHLALNCSVVLLCVRCLLLLPCHSLRLMPAALLALLPSGPPVVCSRQDGGCRVCDCQGLCPGQARGLHIPPQGAEQPEVPGACRGVWGCGADDRCALHCFAGVALFCCKRLAWLMAQ